MSHKLLFFSVASLAPALMDHCYLFVVWITIKQTNVHFKVKSVRLAQINIMNSLMIYL